MEITTDASVWGIGGWISVGGKPTAYFSDFITHDDELVLGHKRGEHEGQQGFQALALLVAVRLWAPLWRTKRVCLALRNDNVGALTIFSSLKGKSVPIKCRCKGICLGHGRMCVRTGPDRTFAWHNERSGGRSFQPN